MARASAPDLVLVMTDQQRFDQVGYASHGHFETPALDALASQGVRFDAAYSDSTTCVPARAALLTGVHHHRLPIEPGSLALREGFWTGVRALAAAGYETALIGKMHLTPMRADHGFETMRLCEHLGEAAGYPADERDDYHHWLIDAGYEDWRLDRRTEKATPFPYPADAHPTGWVARQTIDFLDTRTDDRPLLLVVSFPHPHAPVNPPEPYASRYDPSDAVLPTTDFAVNQALPEGLRAAVESPARPRVHRVNPSNDRPLRQFLTRVRALVNHIDDALAAILTRLDLDETLLMFTSDHGDYGGRRGLLRKVPWIPFEDLARVPLVVAGTGITDGSTVDEPVSTVDLVPTMLEVAGLEVPSGLDGRSLVPLLTGDHPLDTDLGDRPPVYCATSTGFPMIRQGRYKLIVRRVPRSRALFDLTEDPHETESRHRDVELREIVDELQARLDAQLARPPATL